MAKIARKNPALLFREREKRIEDAMALKRPDRVPIIVNMAFFCARYGGITYQEAMYDGAKMSAAWEKTIKDFAPDTYENPFGTRHGGKMLDAIDYKMLRWPGHGVDENRSFQYLDLENMKADEYDEFLFDPTDFMIRKFWPRVFGSLDVFKNLPPLRYVQSYAGFNFLAGFNVPEMDAAIVALQKARDAAVEATNYAGAFAKKMEASGFPPTWGASTLVPFDCISDNFRSTRGAMVDMYRQPDKLLKMIEKLTPMMIDQAVAMAKKSGCPRIFIPLHKGQEFFMSLDQYKKFYWPNFRDLMMGLINAGLNPCPLVEGDYNSRLDIIKDIPAGKVYYHFEQVDMFHAKDVLREVACIRGGVPISMMVTGTPEDVKERCKKLIDYVGKDGGFIIDAGVGLDDAKEENIRAMIDFTKEYGVYR